jgi:hypothetical protein
VSLPGLSVDWIKAKVDTGARSSSIHAFDLEEFYREGQRWVRFSIHPWQGTDANAVQVSLPVHDVRAVRSSSGHSEDRYVVRTPISLAGRLVTAEVTLSRRDDMGFRMLLGRELLRQGFHVNPAASYRGGRPERIVRRQNRGR